MLRTDSMSASRVGSFMPFSASTIVCGGGPAVHVERVVRGWPSAAYFFERRLVLASSPGRPPTRGSSGSLKYVVETMPWRSRARPASSTSVFDAPTLLRMCSGFQPDLAAAAIACAENFGVVMFRNVSAPEPPASTSASDGRVGDLVALLGHDLDVRPLDRLLEAVRAGPCRTRRSGRAPRPWRSASPSSGSRRRPWPRSRSRAASRSSTGGPRCPRPRADAPVATNSCGTFCSLV